MSRPSISGRSVTCLVERSISAPRRPCASAGSRTTGRIEHVARERHPFVHGLQQRTRLRVGPTESARVLLEAAVEHLARRRASRGARTVPPGSRERSARATTTSASLRASKRSRLWNNAAARCSRPAAMTGPKTVTRRGEVRTHAMPPQTPPPGSLTTTASRSPAARMSAARPSPRNGGGTRTRARRAKQARQPQQLRVRGCMNPSVARGVGTGRARLVVPQVQTRRRDSWTGAARPRRRDRSPPRTGRRAGS